MLLQPFNVYTILGDVANCKACFDDIVVFSSNWREHVDTLSTVFTRLLNDSLTLNLPKCEFAKATVAYLVKQVGQGQHAYKSVKILLCSAPVLSDPDYSRDFKIKVDARATGAGVVLLQDDDDGVENPVACVTLYINAYT